MSDAQVAFQDWNLGIEVRYRVGPRAVSLGLVSPCCKSVWYFSGSGYFLCSGGTSECSSRLPYDTDRVAQTYTTIRLDGNTSENISEWLKRSVHTEYALEIDGVSV